MIGPMNPDREEKKGRYDFAAIESRWQHYWEQNQTFRTENPAAGAESDPKPKFYVLDMFPYPSGAGLHVGHPLGYCGTDIIARYKRMRGFNVLHPMGFDAFGLPAEQYAIETNVHPAVTTRKNIETYRRQLKMFGFSYDWSREISTCDPQYYRWTQWMFTQLFHSWYDEECSWTAPDGATASGRARPIAELAAALEGGRMIVDAGLCPRPAAARSTYESARDWSDLGTEERRKVIDGQRLACMDEIPVNWCPALGTVLSNEEIDDEGRSERGGHPVYRRPLKQWILRITRYAERLLADLDPLDWPEPIKRMQRNWVGRSTGAEVIFPLADSWKIENGEWKPLNDSTLTPALSLEGRGGYARTVLPTSRDRDRVSLAEGSDAIRVYTTRPDTLFGATYLVLAPEHPLVDRVTTPQRRTEVAAYVGAARQKSDMARTAESKVKTGVFSGGFAINPVNGRRIPIWVADYVVMGYGTGAIMAVPGSDSRDFEFACAFDLPIVAVVKPTPDWIAEQVEAQAARADAFARAGFDRLEAEAPDLAEAIRANRAAAAELGSKTVAVLNNPSAIGRLVDHYVKYPRTWRAAFTGDGVAVNSPEDGLNRSVPGGICNLNGLSTEAAKAKMTTWLESTGLGRARVNYKLRDWLFSRQRYWGEPFPVLHGEDGETIVFPDEELPVTLPEMEDFRPTPSAADAESVPAPPLARAKEWMTVRRNGKTYQRDANTMPQWAGSCWYYLRFIDPQNDRGFCAASAERYWMPVDLYVGGAEHAVLHLLYARFWHKVLFDLGHVSTREPFRKLFNQGMIQGFAFRDKRGLIVGPDAVRATDFSPRGNATGDGRQHSDDQFVLRETGEPVTRIVAKMSKSLKNVVNPDEVIGQYGADTFRLYEMYMGPLDASKPWNTRDVPGLFKLCQRIWRLFINEETDGLSPALTDDAPDAGSLRALHKMIHKVTVEIEQLKLNTSIAAIFDFVNLMTPRERRSRAVLEPFVLVIAPFAPHLAEEIWRRLGHADSLAYEAWPACDEALARDEAVEVAVQVNGKIKTRIKVPSDADDAAIEQAAMDDAKTRAAMAGKAAKKVIVVKGRLVNIIV
jgi:leucyl-tRNA synthetase